MMLSVFYVHNVVPGPGLFRSQPDFILALYLCLLILNVLAIIWLMLATKPLLKVIAIPNRFLGMSILTFLLRRRLFAAQLGDGLRHRLGLRSARHGAQTTRTCRSCRSFSAWCSATSWRPSSARRWRACRPRSTSSIGRSPRRYLHLIVIVVAVHVWTLIAGRRKRRRGKNSARLPKPTPDLFEAGKAAAAPGAPDRRPSRSRRRSWRHQLQASGTWCKLQPTSRRPNTAMAVSHEDRLRLCRRQFLDAVAKTRRVADVVGKIRTEHHPVRAADPQAHLHRLGTICLGVVPDAAGIGAGARRGCAAAGGHPVEALVEPPDQEGQRAAGMRRDQFQVRVAVEKAVVEDPGEGEAWCRT